VSFVSRENAPGSLAGRIPAAVTDGRLEKAAGLATIARYLACDALRQSANAQGRKPPH